MGQADEELGAGLDRLKIDRSLEVPIGVQLTWALRARIGCGALAPGRRLPGVRELADLAGVNVNTARAVYQGLERQGLIDSRQGSGTFVADAARADSAAGLLARDVAREARQMGVDPREVAAALYVGPSGEQADEELERRRRMRAQIAALEQSLAEVEIANPGLLGPHPPSPGLSGPRLLAVEELEHVRNRLVRRLAEAQLALAEREAGTVEAARPAPAAVEERAARPVRASKRAPTRKPGRAPGARPSTA